MYITTIDRQALKPPSTCFKFSSETPILFYRRSTTGVSFIQIFDSRIIERLTLARMFPLHAPHSTQSRCNHIWYISNRIYIQVCLKHQIIACRCTGILVQDTKDPFQKFTAISAPTKARAPHPIPLPVLVTVV